MRRLREERGAYAILFVILVVAMFTMVALVVDISAARANVRQNQAVADFAVLSAGAQLPQNPQAACQQAWLYVRANLTGLPAGAVPPGGASCGGLPLICTPATPPADYTASNTGSYIITLRYPVPDGDPAMQGRVLASYDGTDPCARLALTIRSTGTRLFGGIVGSGGLSAPATAVVRSAPGFEGGKAIALLILDPSGCNALLASGQASAIVYSHPTGNAGHITLDSRGDKTGNPNRCSSNTYTVDVTSPNARIKACGQPFDPVDPNRCDPGGVVELFAMSAGQPVCLGVTFDCDPTDVAAGWLFPQPTASLNRATRQAMDHRFNCLPSYPNYAPYPGAPVTQTVPILPCTTGAPPYINQLKAAVPTTGTTTPSGFSVYSGSCSPPAGTVIPPGNWYVKCDPFSVNNGDGTSVTFQGGNVVFEGDVRVLGGELRINTANPAADTPASCRITENLCPLVSSDKAAYVVIKNNGSLTKGAQAQLTLRHTMVLINDVSRAGSAPQPLNLGAGAGAVNWSAPHQEGSPAPADKESPFDRLALWSEVADQHTLGGQAGLNIEGVFFTPFANPFNYAGQGNQFLDKAQFMTFRMNISGQGALRMQPNPNFAVLIPRSGSALIR